MDFLRCECGKVHLHGAAFCDQCGAQPPKRSGTGRQEAGPMTEEEAAVFVAGCVVIGEALQGTGGKWGVA